MTRLRSSSDSRSRQRTTLFALLAVLTGGMAGICALLLRLIGDEHRRLGEIEAQRRNCASPVGPARVERPASQPRGDGADIRLGTEIEPSMLLRLDRYDPASERIDQVKFGSSVVLRPGAVQVVVLWAPWCAPCKLLLPRLRDLFARRASDWGDDVDFVPVQVQDATSPEQSHASFAHLMPRSRAWLADRSRDDELLRVLREPSRDLYRGQLPVVMVLDCNRRVRWAKDGLLTPADERGLERRLDEFVAAAREGAGCTRVWCGNGRCEAGESGRCEIDCGDGPDGVPTSEPTPMEPLPEDPTASEPMRARTTCHAGCSECDARGRCEPKAVRAAICGDGRCGRGETSANCCKDCACRSPLVCRAIGNNEPVCGPKLFISSELVRCGDGRCDADETSAACCQDCPCKAPLVCRANGGGAPVCSPRPLKF